MLSHNHSLLRRLLERIIPQMLLPLLTSAARPTLCYIVYLLMPFWSPLTTILHLNMANTRAQDRLLNATSKDFATSLLPLYSGPQVTIRIGSTSHEYKLPKSLLCKQSTYFTAMFEGPFKEGEEQSATLKEEEDVVTPRSFQMLVQWVCLGRVVFEKDTPDVSITTAIEFARLADMCDVTGMEPVMAEHIKTIILANPGSKDWKWEKARAPDTNTCCLTS